MRRWVALALLALVVPSAAHAAKPQPPPPPPTIVARLGNLAVVSDGTVYEFTQLGAGCTSSLSSATVFGRFFTAPPVSPIAAAQEAYNGIVLTLANGDVWLMYLSCCVPCYKQGIYVGNIFTAAGSSASVPGELGAVAPDPGSRLATAAAGSIQYLTPRAGAVEVHVFDVHGRLVWTTRSEHGSAGRYAVTLDGKDVATGVYFAKIQLPDGSRADQKLTIAR